MKKLFILLVLITMLTSCVEEPIKKPCETDLECPAHQYCWRGLQCEQNSCVMEHPDCGKGRCIPGSEDEVIADGYYCLCDENAVSNGAICVPTCNGYSEECTNFDININQCNMELGYCSISCQGEGSCKEGYYCDNGACEKYID